VARAESKEWRVKALVIGGGVIGTATAYFLTEAGHDVTVVDRADSLAVEGSFANGGMLHASHTEPWNTPAVLGQLFRWIGREGSPLVLRPSALPSLTGWGLGFLHYSRPRHHERNTAVNTRLAVYSQSIMRELRDRVTLDYDQQTRGILKIFRSHKDLGKALLAADLMASFGVRFRRLEPDAMIDLEPALTDVRAELAGGIFYPDDESGDCHRFSRQLGELARARGAELRLGETVQRLEGDRRGIRAVVTDRGRLSADRYVLAAGVDAPLLSKQFGLKLPIRPVKGYSGTLPVDGSETAPHVPIIDEGRKLVITRLGDRLRMAGFAEFAGYDRSIRQGMVDAVVREALKSFPRFAASADHSRLQPWACLRPMTMDGPPILGHSPIPNLFLNTGAGHLGWTFAAGAARVVADIVSERTPEIDLDGLTLARFRH
jgi:D-amino-acid dehydrogenase